MTKLVCFDLDDTIVREIDSVSLLCMLNDKMDEHAKIDALEKNGTLNWSR